MTARELMAIVLRRWPFMILGALITLGAVHQSMQQEPVYWTRFSVVGLPPLESVNPNTLENAPYDLTPLVGLAVTTYNDGKYPMQMATSDSTAYGEGMREGSVVRLFNAGSQWVQVHDRPVIDVQVVNADPAEVSAEAARIHTELAQIVEDRQVSLGVLPKSRMTLITSPPVPVVRAIAGSPSRAALSTGLVGALGTTVLVVLGDRAWSARRDRRRRAAAVR